MKRIGLLSVAAVLALTVFPEVAGGQTTTTAPTTTTSTTMAPTTTTVAPTTSTTVSLATTTTAPNPCVGQPCAVDPPKAVFSAASGQVTADSGGHCWRRPNEPFTSCVALARIEGYKPPTLVVTQGETVTIRFVASTQLTPTEASLRKEGVTIPLPASNPTSFKVDLPVGNHVFVDGLTARWLQGNTQHGITLEVRAGRRLALTG